MSLLQNIKDKIKTIIDEDFKVTEVKYIPKIDDSKLTFGNTGLTFTGTVVFIDMRGSTKILNSHNKTTVAKLHMSFFHAIVKIANSNDGHVRSFNGDSALIFFHGNFKKTISNAVICAMEIKYALSIKEAGVKKLLEKYSSLNFGIGLDHGKILCTKVGIGGEHNRDLFWVGNSVNKSTVLGDQSSDPHNISISKFAYDNLLDWAKFGKGKNHRGEEIDVDMWSKSSFIYNDKSENYYYTSWHCVIS